MHLRDISELVHSKRKEKGWTQTELARRARVSRQLVSDFEKGNSPEIGFQKVGRILIALKMETHVRPIEGETIDDLRKWREAKTEEELTELDEMGTLGKLEYHRRRGVVKKLS